MGWQDILNNFKEQFQTTGPEKYSTIDNPEMRYKLAADRSAGIKQGFGTAASGLSNQVQEEKAAAAAAVKAKVEKGYTREYNKAGGYTFKNPDGAEVSPFQYAMSKGIPLTDALEGSYDPGDRKFVEDYMAMSEDLAAGRYDQNQAMSLLASDYPQIFTGKGTPTGGTNYSFDRAQKGIAQVQGEYNTFQPAKKAKTADEKAQRTSDQFLRSYVDKVNTFKTANEAAYELKRIEVDPKYQSLSTAQKKALQEQLGTIIDEIFPSKGQKIGIGLY